METPTENQVSPEFVAVAERLLDNRDRMIARIEALPADKQVKPNPAGGFSPLELLSHMALSEQMYIDLWHKTDRQKFTGQLPKPNFLYHKIKAAMMKAKPLPAPKDFRPRTQPLLDQGKEHWIRTSNELLGQLSSLRSPHTIAVKHPLLGTMSALDVLGLVEAHHHYHDVRFPW